MQNAHPRHRPLPYRLLLFFCLSFLASASAALPVQASPAGDEITTVTSPPVSCLTVDGSGSTETPIELAWQGTATRAQLILNAAENEAPHAVYVNGQPVGPLPVAMEGYGCRGEAFYLDVPVDALVSGTNSVTFTSDGRPGDQWIASGVRLAVTGQVAPAEDGVRAAASMATVETIFDNTPQRARVQVPDTYDGSPTPVIIMLHGRSGSMFDFENFNYHTAVNARGWFYASPELHGHWPGHQDNGKFHHASLESQADVLGTLQYLLGNYNIDTSRIYLYGSSLGGQLALLTAAKYPDIFAAVFANKPPTDWPLWYRQSQSLGSSQNTQLVNMREECYEVISGANTPRSPTENPFCYIRRSPLFYASNLLHTPVQLTHSQDDLLVPIVHSTQMRDAVNALSPDRSVTLDDETPTNAGCPPPSGSQQQTNHCYEPDASDILDFLDDFTLNQTPDAIDIVTDQDSAYYWMNVDRSNGEYLSEIEVALDQANQAVSVAVSDTQPLTLGFNLGTGAIDDVVSQPGMGLPAATYLVREQNRPSYLVDYTAGYLNVTPASTGQYSLTLSKLNLTISAAPADKPVGQPLQSTIAIAAVDGLGNPVPNGTAIVLTTSAGRWPNGNDTFTPTVDNGALSATLTLDAGDENAQVQVTLGNSSASLTIGVDDSLSTPTNTPPPSTNTPLPPTSTPPTTPPSTTPTPPSATPTSPTGTLPPSTTPNASPTATSTAVSTSIPTVAPTSTPTPPNTAEPSATPTVPPIKTEDPPVAGCRISINDGDVFVRQREAIIYLDVPGAVEMQISNDGGLTSAEWETYRANANWLLSDAGNRIATLSVYAQFRDATGGLLCAGSVASDDIIYDPLPPTVAIVRRQTSAVNSAEDEQARFAVVLSINANDQVGGSGVAEMQIGTDATFAGAVWQPYVPSATLTIAGNQPVYVRVRDGVGNLSNITEAVEVTERSIFLPFVSG